MFNSGWANDCGVELFTHGWVQCVVVVSKPGGSVDLRQGFINNKHHADALAEQLRREDEEIIAVVVAAFNAGIIP